MYLGWSLSLALRLADCLHQRFLNAFSLGLELFQGVHLQEAEGGENHLKVSQMPCNLCGVISCVRRWLRRSRTSFSVQGMEVRPTVRRFSSARHLTRGVLNLVSPNRSMYKLWCIYIGNHVDYCKKNLNCYSTKRKRKGNEVWNSRRAHFWPLTAYNHRQNQREAWATVFSSEKTVMA